ncbi:JAB domain-containing protein [Niabella insulamsoli]|uniref:JAB domain-containing protein n=1 Tax=Niabella insulamsoli TaxID=3144874 RepID=UPI0031FE2442
MEQSSNCYWKVSEVELIYKSKVDVSDRPCITKSRDGFELFSESWNDGKIDFVEQFKIALFNKANKVLGLFEVSSGGVSGTVADPKLIFAAALKANASAILLCHNHPSGNLKPSDADRNLTAKLVAAGRVLDIAVLDHIILTRVSYFSFADEGLL